MLLEEALPPAGDCAPSPGGPMQASSTMLEALPSQENGHLSHEPRCDPMLDEVAHCSLMDRNTVPAATAFNRILSMVGWPSSCAPVLKSVTFPETVASPASPLEDVAHSDDFVNTRRGSDTSNMTEGVIPSSPSDLAAAVSRPLPASVCFALTRRRAKLAQPQVQRRSVRLAKKARTRTPAVVAAQNVLMRKLQFTQDAPPTSADIEAYINTFQQGLTEEQARLILELFAVHVPAPMQETVEDNGC